MKIIELKSLLRTAILTASLAAIMGVSACSSEKEDTTTQSGDAMGTTQGPEVEDTASQGGMPSPTNDTSAGQQQILALLLVTEQLQRISQSPQMV